MNAGLERHPLTTLLARQHWTADMFLRRVDACHRALGLGPTGMRREKVSRWTAPDRPVVPRLSIQFAIADLVGVDAADVHRYGWPAWLLRACDDEQTVLDSPWTPAGTMIALAQADGPPDRRAFLIVVTAALAPLLAQCSTAARAGPSTMGRRVGDQVVTLIDTRLDALRHLDDHVGSRQAYAAAVTELQMITQLLREASYSEATGRRLYSAAAEASRLAGWCAYDEGRSAAAERHLLTALRAAASADDTTATATALAFWANVRYSSGDPQGALDLTRHALSRAHQIRSRRVIAMLHARAARAHSVAGEQLAASRAIDAAFAAYTGAGPAADDLPSMYWITAGELHQVAGSTALALGTPARALERFDAALRDEDPYDTASEPRGTAIYLARKAEAQFALGDIDAATDTAGQVLTALGGTGSARGASTIATLRRILATQAKVAVVRDFLESTT